MLTITNPITKQIVFQGTTREFLQAFPKGLDRDAVEFFAVSFKKIQD